MFELIYVSLYLVGPLKEVKQNTIRVIRRANAKLPHHKGLVLAYLVKNKILFVHHVVKNMDAIIQLRTMKT
jgi:F420-0:gamma-glutamyl ligase-like protein